MRQVEAKEQQNVANAMLHVLEAIDYPLCFLVRRRRSFLPDTAATSAPGLGTPLPHLHRDWVGWFWDSLVSCPLYALRQLLCAMGLGRTWFVC